jgi:hypothetical protein
MIIRMTQRGEAILQLTKCLEHMYVNSSGTRVYQSVTY